MTLTPQRIAAGIIIVIAIVCFPTVAMLTAGFLAVKWAFDTLTAG